MVWLPEFCFAKKFLEMCVKVRMCENSHVRTPARVRNVWAGASRCKRIKDFAPIFGKLTAPYVMFESKKTQILIEFLDGTKKVQLVGKKSSASV